jgi:hypothetical protein
MSWVKPDDGSGTASCDQLVPFHCSERGSSALLLVGNHSPIAMQVPDLEHVTPERSSLPEPGLGGYVAVQLDPFHRSARGWNVPPNVPLCPTARQFLAVEQ